MIRRLFWAILTAFVLFQSFHYVAVATQKPFNEDESFELTTSCNSDSLLMLKEGINGQCSMSPLYYVLQGNILTRIDDWSDRILIRYRIHNMVLAGILVFVFAGLLWWSAYLASAIGIAIYAIAKQPLFVTYAAENRPYMLWILLFGAVSILAALLTKKWVTQKKIPVTTAAFFTGTGLALAMTASPGFIQVCAALGVIVFFLRPKDWIKALPLALPAVCAGFYYLSAGCISHGNQYNLLKTKDYHLVLGVLRLLFPKGNFLDLGLNFLMLIGLWRVAMTARHWRKLSASTTGTLEVVVGLQLLASVVIAGLILYREYYFIQRVFLHLIICYGLLVLLGSQWVLQKITPRLRISAVILFLGASFFTEVLPQYKSDQKVLQHFNDPQVTASCDTWKKGTYTIAIPSGSLNYKKMAAVLAVGRELRACNKPTQVIDTLGNPQTVFVRSEARLGTAWFEILENSNQGESFQVCRKNIRLKI